MQKWGVCQPRSFLHHCFFQRFPHIFIQWHLACSCMDHKLLMSLRRDPDIKASLVCFFPELSPVLHTVADNHLPPHENPLPDSWHRFPHKRSGNESPLPYRKIPSSSENSTPPTYPLYSIVFFKSIPPVPTDHIIVWPGMLSIPFADAAYVVIYSQCSSLVNITLEPLVFPLIGFRKFQIIQ